MVTVAISFTLSSSSDTDLSSRNATLTLKTVIAAQLGLDPSTIHYFLVEPATSRRRRRSLSASWAVSFEVAVSLGATAEQSAGGLSTYISTTLQSAGFASALADCGLGDSFTVAGVQIVVATRPSNTADDGGDNGGGAAASAEFTVIGAAVGGVVALALAVAAVRAARAKCSTTELPNKEAESTSDAELVNLNKKMAASQQNIIQHPGTKPNGQAKSGTTASASEAAVVAQAALRAVTPDTALIDFLAAASLERYAGVLAASGYGDIHLYSADVMKRLDDTALIRATGMNHLQFRKLRDLVHVKGSKLSTPTSGSKSLTGFKIADASVTLIQAKTRSSDREVAI